jgi:hypothetical protein
MSRFIPNENTYVGFSPTAPTVLDAPKIADITSATEITGFVSGLNFSATGSAVPTPNLATLFETSIPGTTTATATLDAYRDDDTDDAWELLPRATEGVMYISRYGGKPTTAGDKLEVWPVRVISRTASNMTNNTVATFTVTFSVPEEPAEDAVLGT